jgi:hypothetical protein
MFVSIFQQVTAFQSAKLVVIIVAQSALNQLCIGHFLQDRLQIARRFATHCRQPHHWDFYFAPIVDAVHLRGDNFEACPVDADSLRPMLRNESGDFFVGMTGRQVFDPAHRTIPEKSV